MLKAIEIGKDYGDKVALNDVSLTFPDKGLVIIKGESGSGKTTLLNLLTAHDAPTSGVIQFDGVEINAKNSESYRRTYCSNIYQDYMLIEDMSVSENIELALQAYGESYSADTIKQLLQKVGIPEEYMSKQASKLSGGEKQRVSIARAIAKDAAMIFADEPTGNLDIKNGEMIMDLLKDISKDRLVVAVSHNEGFNEKYADYSVELVDGAIESCDLPSGEGQVEDKEQTEEFKKISKLKAKTLFKFAFGGIKRKKVKTAVSAVAFVMLCLLSVIFSVCAFAHPNTAYAYSLERCESKNFIVGIERTDFMTLEGVEKFKKGLGFGCSEIYCSDFRLLDGEKDKEAEADFNAKYQAPRQGEYKNDFKGGMIFVYSAPLYLPSVTMELLYNPQIGMDVEVVCGDFPKDYNEVMLPYCYALYLSKACEDFKCDDAKRLVGKEIKYGRGLDMGDYTLKICGIFDEGFYFNDFSEPQQPQILGYYEDVNMLARCAVFSQEIKGIWFADVKKSGVAYLQNDISIKDGFAQDPNMKDNPYYNSNVECQISNYFGYNRFADYAKDYAPLEYNEIYLAKVFADRQNIKVGDILQDTEYPIYKDGKQVFKNFNGVIVKDIIDLPDINSKFVIFSSQYYYDKFVKDANLQSVRNFYFNMNGVKDVRSCLNKIVSVGYKEKIWWEKLNMADFAYAENICATNSFYDKFMGYKYFVFIPLAIISLAGLVAMGFVVTGYLIASKGNSYTILRSLGFGKGNIALIIAVQVLSLILMGCIVGVSMGALGCHLFGKAYIKSQLGSAVAKIATEVVLPMGYAAPLLVVGVSIALGVAVTLIKTRSLFKKSVIENKTE